MTALYITLVRAWENLCFGFWYSSFGLWPFLKIHFEPKNDFSTFGGKFRPILAPKWPKILWNLNASSLCIPLCHCNARNKETWINRRLDILLRHLARFCKISYCEFGLFRKMYEKSQDLGIWYFAFMVFNWHFEVKRRTSVWIYDIKWLWVIIKDILSQRMVILWFLGKFSPIIASNWPKISWNPNTSPLCTP